MLAPAEKWQVVVAEVDEVRPSRQTKSWPCTDRQNSNRYLGCIGVRRCRALGTETCIFGRWPASSRFEWYPRD
jgi:hypothetical protein